MLIKLPRLKGSLVVLRNALSDENASPLTIPSNEPKWYVYCGNWDTLSHFDCKLLFNAFPFERIKWIRSC